MPTLIASEPALLKVSENLTMRFKKSGEGPLLVLMHTIRTQLGICIAKTFTVRRLKTPAIWRELFWPISNASGNQLECGIAGVKRGRYINI